MSTVDTAKLGGGAPDRPPPIATVGVIGWMRANTDVLVDKLLVGAARGKDVVLVQLAEERP